MKITKKFFAFIAVISMGQFFSSLMAKGDLLGKRTKPNYPNKSLRNNLLIGGGSALGVWGAYVGLKKFNQSKNKSDKEKKRDAKRQSKKDQGKKSKRIVKDIDADESLKQQLHGFPTFNIEGQQYQDFEYIYTMCVFSIHRIEFAMNTINFNLLPYLKIPASFHNTPENRTQICEIFAQVLKNTVIATKSDGSKLKMEEFLLDEQKLLAMITDYKFLEPYQELINFFTIETDSQQKQAIKVSKHNGFNLDPKTYSKEEFIVNYYKQRREKSNKVLEFAVNDGSFIPTLIKELNTIFSSPLQKP
jgi:hypothetical protein